MSSSLRAEQGFYGALLLLSAWLLVAVFLVNVDLFDGYQAIANSQYFLGLSPEYFWQRAPALGLLLAPAEWLAAAAGLAPLDVRPHHAVMCLLHITYLFGVWRVLRHEHGVGWPVLAAYLSAIPTLVFFSYAPFISHDIFPGLLCLLLVVNAHAYIGAPSRKRWILMVLLGAALALIKQTYALVWLVVLLACAVQFVRDLTSLRVWCRLAAAAAVSGALCWVIYSVYLAQVFPEVSFWLRPLHLVDAVSMLYRNEGDPREIFYQAVYVRNLAAYGPLAALLVVPAIALALAKRGSLAQTTALVWLALVIALQGIAMKEVRYLGFLAPLTAMLLIPVFERLRQRRPLRHLIFVGVLGSLALVVPEALRIVHPFYRTTVTGFLAPLQAATTGQATIHLERYLSFVSPESSAFFGDRYHRITHFDANLLAALHGIPLERFRRLEVQQLPAILDRASPQDVFLFADNIAARVRPFRSGNIEGLVPSRQSIAVPAVVTLVQDGDGAIVQDDAAAIWILVGASPGVPIMLRGGDRVQLGPEGSNVDARGVSRRPALRVLAYCQLEGCRIL